MSNEPDQSNEPDDTIEWEEINRQREEAEKTCTHRCPVCEAATAEDSLNVVSVRSPWTIQAWMPDE